MSGSPAGKTGESQQPAGESQPPLTVLPVKGRFWPRACQRGPYLFHDLAGTAIEAEQAASAPG